jgi:ribosomal protein S8
MFEPPFMPHQLMEAVWDELGISVSNTSRGVVTDSRAGSDSLRDTTAFS